jgi:hemin uptake protein HemP
MKPAPTPLPSPGACGKPAESGADVARPPLLSSDELLRGHKAIEISHNGVLYRLQATRLGKLILTK